MENRMVSDEKQRKIRMNRYQDVALVIFFLAAAILLFYFTLFRFSTVRRLFKAFTKVISPIFVGFIFAYVLNPVVMLLEGKFLDIRDWYLNKQSSKDKGKKAKKHKKTKAKATSDDNADITNQNSILSPERRTARKLAIAVTIIGAISLITLLIMSVIPAFARSIAALAERFPDYYAQLDKAVNNFIEKHDWIKRNIPNINEIIQKFNFMDLVNTYLDSVVSTAYNGVMSLFRLVYNVVIGLIVSMYILGGKERYIAQLKKMSYAFMKKERAKAFIQSMKKTNQIFKSAILGKILDSIIIGCICFIGMSIIGMFGFDAIADNRVLISVIVGVTNVVPFFGPYIGGVPSVLLLLCVKPICGVVFAIFIVVLQQFDMNFLDPRIVGKSVGLSPFYVLCACLLAGGIFGIPGIIIASPTCAVIYGITKSLTESRLAEQELPLDTQEYAGRK